MPRNSSKTRVVNRCQITGRPHGVYRKLKISRISLRKLSLEGKLNLETGVQEKTDGQALAITFKDGKVGAARNKTTIKNPMDINAVKMKFAGRGEIEKAFSFAMQDLENALLRIPKDKLIDVFQNGARFLNIEIIYPGTKNVISTSYSRDYARLRKFIDEVESSEYGWCARNFIPIMDKYDKVWDEVYYFAERLAERALMNQYKPSRPFKWRSKFFPTQYISTKEYGLVWPCLNKGETPIEQGNIIFGSGSHRLLTLSLSKNDIPVFQKISKEHIKSGKCILTTPHNFDGECLIFEIFINDNRVVGRKQNKVFGTGPKRYHMTLDDECIVDEFVYA